MKKTVIKLLLAFSTLSVNIIDAQTLPQEWLNSFRPTGKCADRLSKIKVDSAGNRYACGYAGGERGTADAFMMKCNPLGDTLWTFYYHGGSLGDDYAYDFAIDTAGNVYVTGASDGTSGNTDCFTAKLNNAGVQQWLTRYTTAQNTESEGNAIDIDATGNIYVAGFFDPALASANWLVLKYNNAGVQQWVDMYNGPVNSDDRTSDIVIAPNGNPTVCGSYWDSTAAGGKNILIRQYNPNGSVVWQTSYSSPLANSYDLAFKLDYVANGELRVAATTGTPSANVADMLGLAFDQNGVLLWATPYTFSASANEMLYGADFDATGKIYFAGSDYSGAIITCINADGTLGWRKEWNGPLLPPRDVFFDVKADNNGSVFVAGKGIFQGPNYSGNGGIDNSIIVKYSDSGDSLWTYRLTDSLAVCVASGIDVVNGKVYATGFKADTAAFDYAGCIIVLDTAGNSLQNRFYDGKGDGVATGAFVKTDAQNNVYAACTVDRFGGYKIGYDVAVVKYDAAGVEQWVSYYSSPVWNNDTLIAMEFDPNGDLILCIATDSAATNTKYIPTLVRMNTNGQVLNTVAYTTTPKTNIFPKTMLVKSDGSIVIGNASASYGGLLLYYDANFNLQWSARIDSTLTLSRVNCLGAFSNGDIAVGGYLQINSPTLVYKGIVQRYSNTGQLIWSTEVDSIGTFDDLVDLDINAAGNIAAATTSGTTIAIVGINGNSGAISWRSIYNPTTTTERVVQLQYTPAGDIAFICSGFNGFVYRYTTVQYSGTGVFDWATVFSLQASDREPTAMMTDANNNIITAGYMLAGTTSNFNYVLVAYNSNGTQLWLNTYASSGFTTQNPDRLRSFTRDAIGNYIVTGESSNESFNNWHYRMVTIKYGSSPVGIDELQPSNSKLVDDVFAYPNPSANGKFNLMDASPKAAIGGGTVYDAQGKLVKTVLTENDVLDLSDQNSGIYFFRYKRNGIEAGTIKLSIQ
jgi:hypothetical protein